LPACATPLRVAAKRVGNRADHDQHCSCAKTASGWISSSGNLRSPAFHRLNTLRAISTFSCDIARAVSRAGQLAFNWRVG